MFARAAGVSDEASWGWTSDEARGWTSDEARGCTGPSRALLTLDQQPRPRPLPLTLPAHSTLERGRPVVVRALLKQNIYHNSIYTLYNAIYRYYCLV